MTSHIFDRPLSVDDLRILPDDTDHRYELIDGELFVDGVSQLARYSQSMASLLQTRPWTVEDLCNLPDDGRRYELIEGELFVTPSPSAKHQRIVAQLGSRLHNHLDRTDQGTMFYAPLDVMISDLAIVQPDIVAIARQHFHRIEDKGVMGPSDFIVEVLSPFTMTADQVRKSRLYAREGVSEYWIVDPDQESIWVRVQQDGRHIEERLVEGKATSMVFTGFEVELSEIFARPVWAQESI